MFSKVNSIVKRGLSGKMVMMVGNKWWRLWKGCVGGNESVGVMIIYILKNKFYHYQ